MKHLKKWLALTLAAVLVMGMLPSLPHAHGEEIPEAEQDIRAEQPQPEEPAAEEPAAEESEPESGTWTWVNPALPEDMVPNAQIPSAEPMGIPNAEPQVNWDYITEEEAVREIRKQLKKRTSSFTLYVSTENSDSQKFVKSLAERALDHTGEPEDGDYLRWGLGQLALGYMRYTEDGYYGYVVQFESTYLTTVAQEDEMDDAVYSAVSDLGVRYKSDYQKICAVYDYLCDNITYLAPSEENETLSYTAYGALINKAATSHGFAVLAYRMLLELDVDIRVVGGAVGQYEHFWNIVELDDLYYNVDAASDAGGDEHQWFLKGVVDFPDHYRYLDYETVAFHTQYPMAAEAYDPDVPGEVYPYVAAGMCGDAAYWILDREGLLYVFGEGAIDKESEAATDLYWSYWSSGIKEVYIEEGITSIGGSSFSYHASLEKITWPNTIKAIEPGAFAHCTALKEIPLHEGLETIGFNAFLDCTSLESVVIPDSVTMLGSQAFYQCSSLKKLVIGSGVQEIGTKAFSECKALTEVTVPDGVETLGAEAFRYCSNLTRVYVGCQTVGQYAFSQCAITDLTLSNTITTIGQHAFDGAKIAEVDLPDHIKVLSGFGGCSNLTRVVLPEGLVELDAFAFSNCSGLKEIVFPSTLKRIGWQAFYQCKSLTSLAFPEGLETISSDAFYDCDGLTEIVLPEGLTYIDRFSSFQDCDGIVEVTFPESLKEVGGFQNCRNLEKINFANSATKIKDSAFKNCKALKNVVLPESLEKIDIYAFYGCTSLTEIVIPEGVTEIVKFAFEGCGVVELTIPSSVTSLNGFQNCPNLERLYLYNSGRITDQAFSRCTKLNTIEILGNLSAIDPQAFYGCTSLTELYIPGTVGYVTGFENCSNLKHVTLEEGVGRIGRSAFENCDALESIVLPESLKYIDQEAFAGCDLLAELDIPRNVKAVAFAFARGCEVIRFYGNAPEFPYDTFSGTTATVYYPEGNRTWNDIITNQYRGTITWVPFHVCSDFEIRDAVEPTCDKDGYTGDTYCVKCGELVEKGEVIPATGHTWGDWEIIQEPTEHTPGQKRRICAVCGSHEDRHIPATGTVFGDVNGDAEINGKDLILLRQSLAGWDVEPVPQNADCNGDGEINGKDLILLRQHLAGWDVTLGPTE